MLPVLRLWARPLILGLATVCLTLIPTTTSALGASSTSSTPTAARIDTAVRMEAAAIAEEAAGLRTDVAKTMNGYARAFRGDLTRDEQRTLDTYVATANRRLNEVVRETRRLERAARGRSVTQVQAAQARSQMAWARAQMAAEESFASARTILEPHMSLVDKIEALSDYTSLMGRFENLGERIDTLGQG